MSNLKRSHSLPVLYVRGTHYEVGYQIGWNFKSLIQDFVDGYPMLNDILLEIYKTEQGKKAYEDGVQAVNETFPQYLDELRGISDGSNVPFHKLFLLHDIDVIYDVGGARKKSGGDIGCTSILLNLPSNVYLGHNEDADKELLNHAYIVQVHITSVSREAEDERFTAYCYAGDVPGFCMGYNEHGFVFSINVLHPIGTIPGKISRHFYCRALLSAKNIEEAIDILKTKGCGCSDGFSVNMAYVKNNKIRMCNVEVAPHPEAGQSIVHVHDIPKGEYYIHCNKYLALSIPENEEITSSLHRHAVISKLKAPSDLKAIFQILGDESDSAFPVYRYPNDSDLYTATIGTGIFDLTKLTWSIYTSNPKSDEDPIMVLPINFKTNE